MRSRSHDDAMAEVYGDDPQLALEIINGVLEDGSEGDFLIVLRQFTKAFGGVQEVVQRANLNPTQLYRTLSAEGNPRFSTLAAALDAMGLRLAIVPSGTAATADSSRVKPAV